jgi:glyoxylase I family protein
MLIGIEHAAIASPDTKKLAQWYVDTLGFIINFNAGQTYFVKATDGSMIEIIASEGPLAPKALKDAGLRHLALSVNDYDVARAELLAKGVDFIGEPIINDDVRVAFFKDPDGNFLHIIQRLKPLP